MRSLIFGIIVLIGTMSCQSSNKDNGSMAPLTPKRQLMNGLDSNQMEFWTNIQSLCGKAFQGRVISAPENDTLFLGKKIVMHVRQCTDETIKIPLFVGEDKSRTWILNYNADNRLQLKHDHRHEDGTPDEITMYGGFTSNAGNGRVQYFPADQETAALLPAAVGNIWWIEINEDGTFTYNLRRVNTDRLFSISFNTNNPEAEAPDAPWGWKD